MLKLLNQPFYLFPFFLYFFLAIPISAQNVENYLWEAEIIEGVKIKDSYQAELPLDLVESANQNDLRIFDKNKKEVPFLIERRESQSGEELIPLKIYNKSVLKDQKQLLEIELEKDETKEVNYLSLSVEGTFDFNRHVSIYGRDSRERNSEWFLIKKDLKLVRFHDSTDRFSQNALQFPETRYRFLKIEIEIPLARTEEDKQVLEIRRVNALKVRQEGKDEYYELELPFEELQFKDNTNRSKKNYFLIDMKGREYLFDDFQIIFDDEDFYRESVLYCAQSKNIRNVDYQNPYLEYLNNSILYHFGNNSIQNEIYNTYKKNCPYYLLGINQGNDLEVKPKKIVGKRRKLLIKFIYEKPFELPFKIYARSDEQLIPIYDIGKKIKEKNIKNFREAKIGEIKKNPQYIGKLERLKKETFSFNLNENAVYIVIVVLIIGIISYMWNLLRKR